MSINSNDRDLMLMCDRAIAAFDRDGLLASFIMHMISLVIQNRYVIINKKMSEELVEKIKEVNNVAVKRGHPKVSQLE